MSFHLHRRKIFVVFMLLAVAMGAALFFSRGNFHVSEPSNAQAPLPAPSPAPMALTNAPESYPASLGDMSTALDQALREQEPRKRAIDFGNVLALWIKQNPEGALAYVRKMPQGTDEYTEGMRMVLGALG